MRMYKCEDQGKALRGLDVKTVWVAHRPHQNLQTLWAVAPGPHGHLRVKM